LMDKTAVAVFEAVDDKWVRGAIRNDRPAPRKWEGPSRLTSDGVARHRGQAR
jgi:hypothetical protein